MGNIERIIDAAERERIRAGDVTGSVVGALFGLCPHETIYGLHAKISGVTLPKARPTGVMVRGQELEELVMRYVQRAHPEWCITQGNGAYLRDPELGLGGTPDGIIVRDGKCGILEAKTVATPQFRDHWQEHGPPTWIILQTLTYMLLERAEFGVVAALELKQWGPPELHEYEVPWHDKAAQRIVTAVEKFRADIAAGRLPQPDYARDAALITAMLPKAVSGKIIDLTGDNRMPVLLDERERLKAQIAEATKRCKELDAEIKDKIGDAEVALVPGWRITLKTVNRSGYVVEPTSYRDLRTKRDETAAGGGAATSDVAA